MCAQGETATDSFGPFLDGPLFTVHDAWLRSWLDALAFSLSGLPAAETSAAAMAYVLFDMHREGAALDYPKVPGYPLFTPLIPASHRFARLSAPVTFWLFPFTAHTDVSKFLSSASQMS
jgi:hypothetical protein